MATFAFWILGLAGASPALVGSAPPRVQVVERPATVIRAAKLTFRTLDDSADPTFNQLLGIDHAGVITGYYGSGAAGHPNRGYTLSPPYGQSNYQAENYPGAVQTQVTGINNRDQPDTAGFYVDKSGNTYGFLLFNGVYKSYKNPQTTGNVNQLLGVSDTGIGVGFYTDSDGINHGYTVSHANGKFADVSPPGGTNVTASGINRLGDVTGFYTAPSGEVVGFVRASGTYSQFSFPGALATTPFGISHSQTIVGSYVDSSGATHGFVLTNPLGHPQFTKVDDPDGVGTTVINGISDRGALVGFFVDSKGNTNGFLATP